MSRRSTYDSPLYGPKKTAASFEEACDAVIQARPDAHLEGSAGFAWSFMTRDCREMIASMWWSPRTGKYYYRVLSEGSVPW